MIAIDALQRGREVAGCLLSEGELMLWKSNVDARTKPSTNMRGSLVKHVDNRMDDSNEAAVHESTQVPARIDQLTICLT